MLSGAQVGVPGQVPQPLHCFWYFCQLGNLTMVCLACTQSWRDDDGCAKSVARALDKVPLARAEMSNPALLMFFMNVVE